MKWADSLYLRTSSSGSKPLVCRSTLAILERPQGRHRPEQAQIIGPRVCRFPERAKKLPAAKWLAQGTIYPDDVNPGTAPRQKGATPIQVTSQRRRAA